VAVGSEQIYPTSNEYSRLDQNQQSWIRNLRAKTQRFEDPMCFEAWKMTRRCQGAKMEEIHAQSQARENWTIRFGILKYLIFPGEIESD
jgi:hypothetical protein